MSYLPFLFIFLTVIEFGLSKILQAVRITAYRMLLWQIWSQFYTGLRKLQFHWRCSSAFSFSLIRRFGLKFLCVCYHYFTTYRSRWMVQLASLSMLSRAQCTSETYYVHGNPFVIYHHMEHFEVCCIADKNVDAETKDTRFLSPVRKDPYALVTMLTFLKCPLLRWLMWLWKTCFSFISNLQS